jgi:hypothetical protein
MKEKEYQEKESNPNCSEGRSRRVASSRPARAKLARSYLKNKIKTKEMGV